VSIRAQTAPSSIRSLASSSVSDMLCCEARTVTASLSADVRRVTPCKHNCHCFSLEEDDEEEDCSSGFAENVETSISVDGEERRADSDLVGIARYLGALGCNKNG